jgi:hypothetical protein
LHFIEDPLFNRNNFSPHLLRLILGCFFLILGVIGGFLPFIQGWVFIILGLILLKDHCKYAKFLGVRLKRKYPGTRPTIRKINKTIDDWLSKIGVPK